MKFYSALIKKDSNDALLDLVVLKTGFSFSAFFFGFFWFFYHKMWREAISALLAGFLIATLPFFSDFDKFLLQLALSLIIGLNANEWLEAHLAKKRKYRFFAFVCGSNLIDAEVRALENMQIS